MTQIDDTGLFRRVFGGCPSLKVLGRANDMRTQTPVIYAQASINDYLDLVGNEFNQFAIQRRREKHRAYERMRNDIVAGALLPPITLALRPELVPSILPQIAQPDTDHERIEQLLRVPNQVNILDGLQRTHILNDLANSGTQFAEGQTVLLEFWLEKEIRHLVYRIIVLNAGQKPMSMRHQIELLFSVIHKRIESTIQGLELYTENEETRRRRARKYALDRVATAYQSYLTRTPEITRENIVAQQLRAEEVLESSEDTLGEQFEQFVKYLSVYAQLDDEICRVYSVENPGRMLPTGMNWFGSENVMNSFFAAISDFGTSVDRNVRISNAIERLRFELTQVQPGEDPLGIEDLQKIIGGFNPRKVNIGSATRKLLTAGFKEYFRDEGSTSLRECWLKEG